MKRICELLEWIVLPWDGIDIKFFRRGKHCKLALKTHNSCVQTNLKKHFSDIWAIWDRSRSKRWTEICKIWVWSGKKSGCFQPSLLNYTLHTKSRILKCVAMLSSRFASIWKKKTVAWDFVSVRQVWVHLQPARLHGCQQVRVPSDAYGSCVCFRGAAVLIYCRNLRSIETYS